MIESEWQRRPFLGPADHGVTQAAAARRFHQGLHYILGMTDRGRNTAGLEDLLGITTIMAYIRAYAFPEGNLFDLKQRMLLVFEPLRDSVDAESLVDRALRLAEVFRRPWTEPIDATGPTI